MDIEFTDDLPDDVETLEGQSYMVNGKEVQVLMVLGGPLEIFCLMRWTATGRLFQETVPVVIKSLLNSQ